MRQKVLGIKDIERRKIKERLESEYQRFVRNNQSFNELPLKEKKYYSSYLKNISPEMVRIEFPTDAKYKKVLQASFSDYGADFLDIVIYQGMKYVYGTPDAVTAEIISKRKKTDSGKIPLFPHEWGYLLCGPRETFFEVLNGNRYPEAQFIIWHPTNKNDSKKIHPEIINGAVKFFSLLKPLLKIIGEQYSIENKLPGTSHQSTYYTNLYQQNLSAAKEFLELSKSVESSRKHQCNALIYEGKFKEAHDFYMEKGAIYLSAMIYFIMAFEGFKNQVWKKQNNISKGQRQT